MDVRHGALLQRFRRESLNPVNDGLLLDNRLVGSRAERVLVLAAGVAWLLTTMPQDVQRLLRSIAGADEFTGLQAGQFSLFHLLGLLTVACLAVAPIFYGGLAAGFSKSPLILLGGMLAVYRRYGLAFGMLVILVRWKWLKN